MVRLIGIGAGAVLAFVLLLGFFAPRAASTPDPTERFHKNPANIAWSWEGPTGLGIFGTFNRQQLQRGFQVYKEVCSACHNLRHVAFRDLKEIGFSEPEVKAIAKTWQIEVPSINPDTGEAATRPATPADHFPLVYPNEVAARAANNNALPPDLSMIVKARAGGADYVHSLLTGFQPIPTDFPKDHLPPSSLHYNPYFKSLAIAMPPPLHPDLVTYADGQPKATVDQMAQDVAAFLTWAAEPKLEARRRAGLGVVMFLIAFSTLAYLSYRRVWADLKK